MATDATGNVTQSQDTDRGSRTIFHIFAGLVAAGMLVAALSFFSFYSHFFRERQIHAIQQGVHVDLRLIASAEKAFYEKHGAYTTDLAALSIAPKKVLYKFGFVAPSGTIEGVEGLEPSRLDLDALKASNSKLQIDYSPVTKLNSIQIKDLATVCPDCTATQTGFKAIAAANLDEDPTLDVWTIDDKGTIVHVVNDL